MRGVLALLIGVLLGELAVAEEAKPILRIETGMHIAPIRAAAADSQGLFLATSSHDATVRVWNIRERKLVRIFRIPAGALDIVRAVAISADARSVAVGQLNGKESRVFIFTLSTGRLEKVLGPFPASVVHVAFSRKGDRLAVALGADSGVRVLRLHDGTELGRTQCEHGSNWAEFSLNDRLVTSCGDSFVRLYDHNLNHIATSLRPLVGLSYAARFSPDGTKIAVGYDYQPIVEVLSASDMKLLYKARTSGLFKGLAFVAWSSDGYRLYAGGTARNKEGYDVIRVWSSGGQGEFRDVALGNTNTVMGIEGLPSAEVVFAGAAPAWGILNEYGEISFFQRAFTADLTYCGLDPWNLRVSHTGDTVAFCIQAGGRDAAVFSISDQTLRVGQVQAELRPPLLRSSKFKLKLGVSDRLKLNGKKLDIDADEFFGLAFSPDESEVIIATDGSLISFTSAGEKRIEIEIPSVPKGVTYSGNGKVIIATFFDGTVRWFRSRDGGHLLSLFPHMDGRRWVAWTSSGFYAASVGGEDLIGWQINRKPTEAADWFSIARFRSNYYRPDILERIIETQNEEQAVKEANALAQRDGSTSLSKLLPPVVEILDPQNGASFATTKVSFLVSVRSPLRSKVTTIRTYVDGRPEATARGFVKGSEAAMLGAEMYSLVVVLPPRDCTVSVVAETEDAISDAVSIVLIWKGPKEEVRKPRLNLLAVGIASYQRRNISLAYPAKDARDIAAFFRAQEGKFFESVRAKVLPDAQATKATILEGLDWLLRESQASDISILFFAGHGRNEPRKQEFFFYPFDVDPLRERETALSDNAVTERLAGIRGKVILFLDTCHSGLFFDRSTARKVMDVSRLLNEISDAENGIAVFSASSGAQESQESDEWQNGAFTRAVLDGLKGSADFDGSGTISIGELDLYIARRVRELTGNQQIPSSAKPKAIPDFDVASVR